MQHMQVARSEAAIRCSRRNTKRESLFKFKLVLVATSSRFICESYKAKHKLLSLYTSVLAFQCGSDWVVTSSP